MVGRRPQYTRSNWRSYIASGWNWQDLAAHTFMLISIVLHVSLPKDHFSWARGFYAVTLYLSFLRIIHIFYASKYIGPLVIMIRDMVNYISIN